MAGDAISAATALEWGFVNAVVADDELDAAVSGLMARATRGSRESKAIGKRAYYDPIVLPEDQAYAFASAVMADAVVSEVAQEGINAFLAKRSPEFGGR